MEIHKFYSIEIDYGNTEAQKKYQYYGNMDFYNIDVSCSHDLPRNMTRLTLNILQRLILGIFRVRPSDFKKYIQGQTCQRGD